MSTATPAASSSSGAVSPTIAESASIDRLILEYLHARGHKSAESALREILEANTTEESEKTVSSDELIKSLAVFAQKPSRPGENVLKDNINVLQELTTMGNPPNIQNLIASLGGVGAEDILSVDPTDKQEGFKELEAWVQGSLDMYKACPSPFSDCPLPHVHLSSPSFVRYSTQSFVTSISISSKKVSRKLVRRSSIANIRDSQAQAILQPYGFILRSLPR